MARVKHTQRHYHTPFRKLALGQPFWFATNLATAPNIKVTTNQYITGWAASPDGSMTRTTTDTSLDCVRVPGWFMAQNRTLT